MYISGNCDNLDLFLEGGLDKGSLINELCQLNPHLDKNRLVKLGTLPSFTPILEPAQIIPHQLRKQQLDLGRATRLSLEEKKKVRLVCANKEGFARANQIIYEFYQLILEFHKRYLQPKEFAISYSILNELANRGRDAIELSDAYSAPRNFIRALKEQDVLLQEYRHALNTHKRKNHPSVVEAWKKAEANNRLIRKMHPEQLSQLPKDTRRQVNRTSIAAKNIRKGSTAQQNRIHSHIGSTVKSWSWFGTKYISYETMQKVIKGTKIINRFVLGLGGVAATIESHEALRKGEDVIRPYAKWAGSFVGGSVAGYYAGQAAITAIPLEIAAFSSITAESVLLFLTCTPVGWITVGVVVGTAGYFGSEYGGALAENMYGWAKEKTVEVYDAGRKIIDDSWDAICEYAYSLMSSPATS